MMKSKFEQFIKDQNARRLYEGEALAFEAADRGNTMKGEMESTTMTEVEKMLQGLKDSVMSAAPVEQTRSVCLKAGTSGRWMAAHPHQVPKWPGRIRINGVPVSVSLSAAAHAANSVAFFACTGVGEYRMEFEWWEVVAAGPGGIIRNPTYPE